MKLEQSLGSIMAKVNTKDISSLILRLGLISIPRPRGSSNCQPPDLGDVPPNSDRCNRQTVVGLLGLGQNAQCTSTSYLRPWNGILWSMVRKQHHLILSPRYGQNCRN